MEKRVNRACSAYPCHDKLEDCTFCYCPLFPCADESRGKFLSNGQWDCSNCTWPHNKERIDRLFEFLKRNWKG
jgi:Zn-finger protein